LPTRNEFHSMPVGITGREIFEKNRSAALAEWRQLAA
jgi:hypothetical protein